jgi:PAS domain S-box-containing protein
VLSVKPTIHKTFSRICIATLISFLFGLTAIDSFAAEQKTKRVFILNSFNRGYTWTDNMLRGIDDAFVSSGIKVETYVTFMDMKRIPPTAQYFSKLKELIKDGYKGVRFDAVLACDNDALEFLRKYRDELFPNVPVVFSSINDFDERMLDGRRDITGTSENTDYVSTIRVALKLRPVTKNIVVVVDNTTTGKAHRSAVEKIRQNFPQNLQFTYISLADMTLDELAQQLSKLKSDSIVLLLQHFVDKNRTTYTVQQSTPFLTKNSSVPAFALADIRVGLGALGGYVVSGYHHGEAAAQMVVKILNGVDIGSIPVLLDSPNRYMFDYGAMQRFNISESDLPQDSIIVNEPVSLLHEYKPHITAIIVTFIILCLILVFLLLERMRRSKSDRKLRESEERHRTILLTAMDGVWRVDLQGRFLEVNEAYCRMSGYSRQELLAMSISDLEAVEDSNDTSAHIEKVIAQSEDRFESRHRRKDGSFFYVEVSVQYRPSEGGQLVAFLHDITENKRSEELLRKSEFRFRELAEMLPSVVFETDAQGILTFVNRKAFDRFEFTQEDFAGGLNALDMVKTDDRDRAIENMLRIMNGEITGSNEYTMQRKKGSSFPALIHSTVIVRDGKPAGLRGFIVDITESKRIERELRETKERYDYTTMIGNVGTWDWHVPTGNLVWNDETFRLLGLIPGAIVPSYELFLDLVHKEDREFLDNSVKASWYENKPYSLDCRIVQEGGKEIMCYITGKVEFDSKDQPARMLGTIQDITERKRTEEKLLYISKAVESSSNAIGISDPQGHHFYQNRALSDLFEYATAEELEAAGGGPAIVKDPKIAKEMFDNIMNGKSWAGELEMVTKSGHVFPAFERADAIKDAAGKMIGLIGIITDISDRKQAEIALRKSEEEFRSLAEAMPQIVWATRKDGWNIYFNRQWVDYTGLTLEESYGHGWNKPFHPDDQQRAWDAWQNATKNSGVYSIESRLRRKDGVYRWWLVRGVPLIDETGGIVKWFGTCTDIDDIKQAVEERQSIEERLRRAEKMESLGLLAGGVAHDLNNVLGIVVGYAELIMESVDASSSIKPHLMNIMNGGQKAAAIVNDLLTLARRGVSGKEVINLNEIVVDCQHSPEFEKLYSYHPSVKINSHLEPDQPNITCSSVHLGKSLYNLVSNACEAMPKGGIVTIKTTSQYLEQPIQGYDEVREGDYVVLSVSDTGEGVSDNDMKRIFEPFYTKKVMGRSGTGLGLSVVWGTVKDHNGYINVQSEKGKGSTFTLYFPATREDITTKVAHASISEYMGKGESILVVDDVKEQRDLAVGMLRTLNYSVSGVFSGEEALAYLKENQADLIVLDMIMDPGMDGLDTYRSILEIRPKQKAIIVSGFSESDRVYEAQKLGAGAYVKKPYIKEKLGLDVRKELDRK